MGIYCAMTGLLFALFASAVDAQTAFVAPKQRKAAAPAHQPSPVMDPEKPSVYIEFIKAGKAAPLFADEARKRIWLRLTNNMRFVILVSAFGVPDEYGDVGLFHEVEASGTATPDGALPHGYWWDVSTSYPVEPGESVTFSVPQTNLDAGLAIRVDFRFDWGQVDDTRHSVYFSYWSLPASLHDKAKEAKLKCRFMCYLVQDKPMLAPPELPEPPMLVLPMQAPVLPFEP